jgi:CRISPR/Cas system-associated exonuclease Cas4 (RecB family)
MLTLLEHFFFTITNETRNKTITKTIPIITEIVEVEFGSIGCIVVVVVDVVRHLTSLIQCIFNSTWVIEHSVGSSQRVQSLVLYTLNIYY